MQPQSKPRLTSAMRRAGVALLLALSTACSSTRVIANHDPNADFSSYQTFDFHPEIGMEEHAYGSLLTDFMRAAALIELEQRGYARSIGPDLLVNIYITTRERIRSTASPTYSLGYGVRGRCGYTLWVGHSGYRSDVQYYTEGTLNVDIVDRARSRVVWEGAVIGVLTESDRRDLQAFAKRSMAAVFGAYPFTAGEK